ncbi:anthrone oxygenase family protein [Micromonospora sp. KC213]|uniref:anthrone oxygenase family protein n=1 Tax=Micromonospora sp. KC213 TaxID=2530378 RepID=UPI00104D920C|nr:anthrone oxygenase family protein [Micromonospora sp. KC213]TDC43472.1 DUF1772 domain-containing protein [Micromonospora sp. KC213]
MEQVRIAVLAAATLFVGLSAGVFFTYSTSVMLALRQTEDRVLIDVMQKVNVVILNGWFLTAYVGALVLAIVAVVLHRGPEYRAMFPWLLAATVLYVILFAVTAFVSAPLNYRLDRAGPVADMADPAAVRAAFEATWNRWNLVRTLAGAASLLTLAMALLKR